jgi:ribonuclease PH
MTRSPRPPGRKRHELRPTTIEPYPTAADGSVVIAQGGTRVLCTASVADSVPDWLVDRATGTARQGWVTAEYSMLPGSTPGRKKRGLDSRGTEIQRLIGRALRAAVDMTRMPGTSVTCDCDVLRADGGTRTAAITGAFVALALALDAARRRGLIEADPILGPVAAVSVGIVGGQTWLDLDYERDVAAAVDMNVAMDHRGQLIEVQATGEQGTFTREQLDELLELAGRGIRKLLALQRQTLRELRPQAGPD